MERPASTLVERWLITFSNFSFHFWHVSKGKTQRLKRAHLILKADQTDISLTDIRLDQTDISLVD